MQKPLLCQQLLQKEKSCGDFVYLRQAHEGQWHEMTWKEVMHQARQVANFLTNLGLKRGDCVSIFSKNCAEWIISDFGITLAGMINVPLFPNQNQQTIDYILNHAQVKLVFLGKLDAHQRTRTYIPEHFLTVNFPYHLELEATHQWTSILSTPPIQQIDVSAPEDIYTIIYSSGTTGQPKGVVFTQGAIANYLVSLRGDLQRLVKVNMRHHLLSYLPLAHVYERSTVQLASLVTDSDIAFVESLDKFAKNLQEVQPTMFTAVPRIWGLFKQKVEQQIEKKKLRGLLKLPLISQIIKRKIKQQLGLSHCRLCVSGAAHLPANVVDFFKNLDIIIQEGSGQTEDLGYTTLTERHDIKPGWVGTSRYDVQIKRSEQGELLVHSPFLMKEYYKERTLTLDSFTAEGWLKTGDLVEIDDANRVKILGRLSENFKNQKGEFVTPSTIEDQFIVAPFIEQCCLVGKMLPSNVLLVNLSNVQQNASESEVKDALRKLQHDVNRKLKIHEKISHILVIREPWTITNHCLTPTMKIRRRMIESIYQDLIQNVVSMPVGVVWQ
jgi:long-chain acyl-CoA synthetase